jgi:two-component system sensor histidine kinase YesM
MTRRPGLIKVTGRLQDHHLVFTVEDNGLGMTKGELQKLRESLSRYDVSNHEMGFGLYNVFKRIQLYYEIDNGLMVESDFKEGCKVTLRLPMISSPVPVEPQAASVEGG